MSTERENIFYKTYKELLEEGLGSTLRKVGAGAALGLGSLFGANKYIDDESKIPPPPPAKTSTDFPRTPLNIKDIDARARERIKAEQATKAKEAPSRIQKTRETLKGVDITLNEKIKKIITSIEQQETGHLPQSKRDTAIGDNGRAFGRYQIHKGAVMDVNRVYGTNYKHSDMFNRKNAEDVLMKYLTFWGKYNNKHRKVELSYRNLAAMWNGGGPSGWKPSNKEAHHYANDVVNILKNKLASN